MYQFPIRAGLGLRIAYSCFRIPFGVTRQNSFGFFCSFLFWGGWIGLSAESKLFALAAGGVFHGSDGYVRSRSGFETF